MLNGGGLSAESRQHVEMRQQKLLSISEPFRALVCAMSDFADVNVWEGGAVPKKQLLAYLQPFLGKYARTYLEKAFDEKIIYVAKGMVSLFRRQKPYAETPRQSERARSWRKTKDNVSGDGSWEDISN